MTQQNLVVPGLGEVGRRVGRQREVQEDFFAERALGRTQRAEKLDYALGLHYLPKDAFLHF